MVGWYKNDKEDNAHCRAAFVFQSLHWISEHLKQYSAIQHNATHCNATRCNALLHFKQAHNTHHFTSHHLISPHLTMFNDNQATTQWASSSTSPT